MASPAALSLLIEYNYPAPLMISFTSPGYFFINFSPLMIAAKQTTAVPSNFI
jgi:hypothetical protein